MENWKLIQNVYDKDVMKLEKALKDEGYQIRVPIYSLLQERELPAIHYLRREYKIAFGNEPEKWKMQMCIAASVIRSGEAVLREYDLLSSADELFETFPVVKEHYQQVLKILGL